MVRWCRFIVLWGQRSSKIRHLVEGPRLWPVVAQHSGNPVVELVLLAVIEFIFVDFLQN